MDSNSATFESFDYYGLRSRLQVTVGIKRHHIQNDLEIYLMALSGHTFPPIQWIQLFYDHDQ